MSPFLQNENRLPSHFASLRDLRGKEIATSGRRGRAVYNNYRWCKMVVDDKIADAHREASYDRLVLTTQSGTRHTRPHLLIRLRQTLGSPLEWLRAVL